MAASASRIGGAASRSERLAAVAIHLLVIWLLNATLVPGVNESHYLPKAKHAWDPTYAPGDLFLSSGNAHWLFSEFAGCLSTFLSLTAVAWVGRLATWVCMAVAWQRLAQRLRLPQLPAAVMLAGWIVAVRLGNWAGEWAVGGFEAKALAYPFVVLALAELIAGKWSRVWLLSSVAVAFHPLVGGWAGLSFALGWLWFGRRAAPLRSQLPAGLLAVAIAMVGILPALAMIGGPSRSGDVVVAQIHAFYRLAHHQSPRLFSLSQHLAGAISLGLFVAATLMVYSANPAGVVALIGGKVRLPIGPRADRLNAVALMPAVLGIAWLSIAISGCGALIDIVGSRLRPDLAASLLRFYWFRWSDVMVPLASVCGLWSVGLVGMNRVPEAVLGKPAGDGSWRDSKKWAAVWLAGLCLITVWLVGGQVVKQWRMQIAPADQSLLMEDSPEHASGPEVVYRWQAVCAWVAENTPSDALFLTPRAQQTFKWYAGRAEVVSFKDVPQDSRSLLEWYDRVGRCAPPRNAAGEPLGWTTEQLKRLQARYGFQYVIVDRRIQREPPLLEIVYPISAGTLSVGPEETFAVFKLPDIPSQ